MGACFSSDKERDVVKEEVVKQEPIKEDSAVQSQQLSRVSSEKSKSDSKRENSIPKDGPASHIAALTFTFRELAAATKNFRQDCLIGEGGFGRVYKGRLESTGQVVAVKQLDRNGLQGNREFLVEVLMLSLLHHTNLVNLIGYCADGDQRLLVYEYMPLGSLEDHLHGFARKIAAYAPNRKRQLWGQEKDLRVIKFQGLLSSSVVSEEDGKLMVILLRSLDFPLEEEPLDWYTRMKIATGAAKGLEYLHDKANPPVIYRDFKSSNILLDEGFHPKLSDFGLAKLGPVGDKTHVSTRVMGTYGYCAPEYAMTGQLTLKSDVYSFGVVFLELITGRKAIDNTRAHGEQNLVAWARPLFKDRRKFPKMVDPLLQGRYPMRGLYQALAVAAMCLQEQAATRPLIGDVVTALQYLANPTCDLNVPSAQSSRVGPSTPMHKDDRKSMGGGSDSQDEAGRFGRHFQSPNWNSPDRRHRDPLRGMNIGAESGRGEPSSGSGRKGGLDELERQGTQRDSPVHARETPRNFPRDFDRERAVAEAKVWGENWRERQRANAIGSFDGTNEQS